mgnify:CR=1 FL=1
MSRKLRYYYERLDMLSYQSAYYSRILRSGSLLYDEKDLTINDGHKFWDPPKVYRLCRFYECDDYDKVRIWHGYNTGDYKF